MKKIIVSLLTFSFVLVSCDMTETLVYDNENGQALAAFSSVSANLPVPLDGSNSVNVQVSISTISDTDRTVGVSYNEAGSQLPASALTFSSSVTIPANSYFGTFTVTVNDNDLITTSPQIASFVITDVPGGVGEKTLNVSIFKICPIPADYMVGSYAIEDVSAAVGPDNGTENFAAGTVNIAVASDDPNARQFVSPVLPAFNSADETVVLSMICGVFVMSNVDPNLTCGGGIPYYFTNAVGASTYDLADDSVFTITYVEDPEGSCGGPFTSSFRLTKQ